MKARHEFKDDEAYYEYLRHYYAGQAMQGLLSNNIYHNPNEKHKMVKTSDLSSCAVSYSDALINQLKQKQ